MELLAICWNLVLLQERNVCSCLTASAVFMDNRFQTLVTESDVDTCMNWWLTELNWTKALKFIKCVTKTRPQKGALIILDMHSSGIKDEWNTWWMDVCVEWAGTSYEKKHDQAGRSWNSTYCNGEGGGKENERSESVTQCTVTLDNFNECVN